MRKPLPILLFAIAVACSEDPLPKPASSELEPGTLVLSVFTTGSRPDSNGYTLKIDGVSSGQLPDTIESELSLPAGDHTIELGDVSANCTSVISLKRTIKIAARGRTAVGFVIECPGQTSLQITTVTSGTDPDPDGYVVSISNTWHDTIAPNGALQLTTLREGSYVLQLSSVAGNCTVTDGATRYFYLQDDLAVTLTFSVTCVPRSELAPGEKLVLSAVDPGSARANLYLLDPNDGSMQRVTNGEGNDQMPDFSRDGQRILFTRYLSGQAPYLVVLEPETGRETVLATTGFDRAVWSPDGTKIAFTRNGRLYTMAADGTTEIPLTAPIGASGPYWSPDGTRIAFSINNAVMVINADGSGMHQVSKASHLRTAGPWSPDGQTLLANGFDQDCSGYYYWYYGCSTINMELYLIDVATGEERRLTNTPTLAESSPVWSLSGDRVYFVRLQNGNLDVFSQWLSEADPVNLTRSAATEQWISVAFVRKP